MFLGIAMGWFGFMPSFSELEDPQTYFASEIYSHDNELIGTYFIEIEAKVIIVKSHPDLVNALIATEDVRFYKHSGIDLKALLRVLYGTIMGKNKGEGVQLTQQLAKNLFPREYNQSSLQLAFRKFKEWVIAIKLESRYAKMKSSRCILTSSIF